ncbi:MAG: AAA family ATPase, partial [Pseudomonadota bacterium]
GTRATEGAASLPLLGRAGEMERLQATWAEVAAGGHRTLYLRGQAGIGKSRIMAEFAASIAEEARIIRFFASPDAMQSPLRPIIDELEALAGFRTSDTAAERDGRLSDLLRSAALDDPAFFAIFAEALGLPGADTHDATALSPERRKAMLFEGLGRIVLDRAGGRPLAVIFEDLHWLDPASLEFARHLASVMADTRSMLLGTVRPEGELIWQAATPPPVTVELDRLEDADAIELLRLQGRVSGALDEEAIRGILERADGVPLYLEELTKSAAESRSETAIPFTLQEALMARLDRLGQAKRITQMAAVIGR